jgi:hypothetical protein
VIDAGFDIATVRTSHDQLRATVKSDVPQAASVIETGLARTHQITCQRIQTTHETPLLGFRRLAEPTGSRPPLPERRAAPASE